MSHLISFLFDFLISATASTLAALIVRSSIWALEKGADLIPVKDSGVFDRLSHLSDEFSFYSFFATFLILTVRSIAILVIRVRKEVLHELKR